MFCFDSHYGMRAYVHMYYFVYRFDFDSRVNCCSVVVVFSFRKGASHTAILACMCVRAAEIRSYTRRSRRNTITCACSWRTSVLPRYHRRPGVVLQQTPRAC
ncbi:unnamed protein product [Laminaria digitata]